ncbi:hypothetical protein Bca4012_077984 [Brassica carinata]
MTRNIRLKQCAPILSFTPMFIIIVACVKTSTTFFLLLVSFQLWRNSKNAPITSGVDVSRVEILPYKVTINDNPVFRITAFTHKNISSSSTVSARMILEGGSGRIPKSSRRGYQLCDSTKHCPVVAGSFGLAFPHPYWRHKIEAISFSLH